MNSANASRAITDKMKKAMETPCQPVTLRAAAAVLPCGRGRGSRSRPATEAMRADSTPERRSRPHAISAPTPNVIPPRYRTHQLIPGSLPDRACHSGVEVGDHEGEHHDADCQRRRPRQGRPGTIEAPLDGDDPAGGLRDACEDGREQSDDEDEDGEHYHPCHGVSLERIVGDVGNSGKRLRRHRGRLVAQGGGEGEAEHRRHVGQCPNMGRFQRRPLPQVQRQEEQRERHDGEHGGGNPDRVDQTLHAGVDSATIALRLGHERVQTTDIYHHADMSMKEKALARLTPPSSTAGRYRASNALMRFLSGP